MSVYLYVLLFSLAFVIAEGVAAPQESFLGPWVRQAHSGVGEL